MDQWLKDNALSIITLFIVVAGIIANRARKDAKLDQIGESVRQDVDDMNARIDKVENEVETVASDLAKHRENTARHRDPDRDERTHREFMQRFDKLETMLMRLMNKTD